MHYFFDQPGNRGIQRQQAELLDTLGIDQSETAKIRALYTLLLELCYRIPELQKQIGVGEKVDIESIAKSIYFGISTEDEDWKESIDRYFLVGLSNRGKECKRIVNLVNKACDRLLQNEVGGIFSWYNLL